MRAGRLSDGGAEPIASIADLHREVQAFQDDPEADGEFVRLLRAGTSQGGLRPKAAVTDEQRDLWIAKFPSELDTYDIETCEAAALHVGQQGL